MKPLTKKVLEAGLVDKHVAIMFEKWGQLESGSSEIVAREDLTKQSLEHLIDEIDELIDRRTETKETRLEISARCVPKNLYCPEIGTFSVVEDEMGRLIVSSRVRLNRGDHVFFGDEPCQILDVEPLHSGDRLIAYQITIDKPE